MNKKELLHQKLAILSKALSNLDEAENVFQEVESQNLEVFNPKLKPHAPTISQKEINTQPPPIKK